MTNYYRRYPRTSRNARKTFNLHWVNGQLDGVIVELKERAGNAPEIDAAIATIIATKKLLSAYSKRLVDTPYQ